MKRCYNTDYIHSGSLKFVLFYAFEEHCDMQRLYHIDYMSKERGRERERNSRGEKRSGNKGETEAASLRGR